MFEAASDRMDSSENRHLVEMLYRSRLFRDYENVFTKATGLPLALWPFEYWQLAHHGEKNENPFCAALAEHHETLAICLQVHEQMIEHTGDIPHTVICRFGLTETAVPAKLVAKTIGCLRSGQVLRRSSTAADTKKVSKKLASRSSLLR